MYEFIHNRFLWGKDGITHFPVMYRAVYGRGKLAFLLNAFYCPVMHEQWLNKMWWKT